MRSEPNRRHAARAIVGTLLTALCWVPGGALADGGLDVRGWLDRPGVKVLAVEFYATWCKPCMEAVPRWKALHDKYRDEGLRLVVVNTLDAGGACRSVPWTPDKTVCDIEGTLAKSFGVGGNLPAAFVWSWQGNLLVRKGHIGVAEQEIGRYLGRSPRVVVETRGLNGKPDAELATLVRNEIIMAGKLQIVASKAERERLAKLRKDSHRAAGRDDHRCKLGAELSANSLLDARLIGSAKKMKLSVALHSAETGCMLASSWVAFNPKRKAQAVREAVVALSNTLRQAPAHPTGGGWGRPVSTRPRPVVKEGHIGGPVEEWDPTGGQSKSVLVRFESTPAGAIVLLDGRLVCKSTPCQKALEPGRVNVDMQLDDYQPHKEIVRIDSKRTVAFKLKPDFAMLDIVTVPPGVQVRIDGKTASGTALKNRRMKPGAHELVIDGRCYYKTGERVVLKRGDKRVVTLEPKPRPSAIKLSAQDDKGNELTAKVFIDGAAQSQTAPGIFKVPVCSKTVRLEYAGMRVAQQTLQLQEKKLSPVTVIMRPGARTATVYGRAGGRAGGGVEGKSVAAATQKYPGASPAYQKGMAIVLQFEELLNRAADRAEKRGGTGRNPMANKRFLKKFQRLGKLLGKLKEQMSPAEKARFDRESKARLKAAVDRFVKASTGARTGR